MPIINSCCCVTDLRNGGVIVACIYIIKDAIFLLMSSDQDTDTMKEFNIYTEILGIIFSLLVLVGISFVSTY